MQLSLKPVLCSSVGLFRLGSLEFWLEWIDKGSKLFSNERNKI